MGHPDHAPQDIGALSRRLGVGELAIARLEAQPVPSIVVLRVTPRG